MKQLNSKPQPPNSPEAARLQAIFNIVNAGIYRGWTRAKVEVFFESKYGKPLKAIGRDEAYAMLAYVQKNNPT